MESTTLQINYVIFTTVIDIREEFHEFYESGIGKDAVFRKESRGWFVFLDGSHEGICLGVHRPVFAKGDTVKVTFGKVPNADTRPAPIE